MNTITNLNTFPLGNTLDGINIITDEINTASLLVDGTNSMLADLNMNNHSIKNLDDGVNSLDAVNKSQLDTKADTTYVNGQLSLKADTTYVNGQLSLKADVTYVDSQLSLKANTTYVDSQLSLKANTTYVDSQLAVKANTTYVDSQLSLKANTTYVNSQDNLKVNKAGDTMTGGLVVNYTNANLEIRANNETENSTLFLTTPYQNGAGRRKTALIANGLASWSRADLHFCLNNSATHSNVTISDSKMVVKNLTGNVGIGTTTPSEKLDVNGNIIVRGSLNMNTTNKIINLSNGTNNNDAINFSQLTNLKTYTDSSLNLLKTYINSQDTALKTYTDSSLNLLKTYVNSQDTALRTYTDSSLNLLKTYVNTQDTALKTYTDASLNLKVNRAGDTMTGSLIINKNSSNSTTTLTSSSDTISLLSGTIYDYYDLTYVGEFYIHVVVFDTQDSSTTLANKTINFKIPAGQALTFDTDPIGRTMNFNGNFTQQFTRYSSFSLICSSTPGYYTTGPYISLDNLDESQLTLKSNVGLYANSEFTEIKFLHTTTDAGVITVETDRERSNSIMRFYTRSANNLILPLDINATINAYKPIIRNAWSSGELIKTTIFSRATTGVSKIANVNANTSLDWLFPTITLRNTPNNSIVVMTVDAPYHFTGASQDTIELYVYDITGGTASLVFAKSQYYDGAGGGGTRSGTIFPFTFSHTPSQATNTATRTYQITLVSRSATDILRLCQGVFNGTVINLDYYTCEMKEIKI